MDYALMNRNQNQKHFVDPGGEIACITAAPEKKPSGTLLHSMRHLLNTPLHLAACLMKPLLHILSNLYQCCSIVCG